MHAANKPGGPSRAVHAVANFDCITPSLAVGGRVPLEAGEKWITEHGIRAVVDLREEDCDDPALLLHHGLVFLHLPTADHCAVSQAMLDRGVGFSWEQIALGARVLVHCEHGIGRSACLALCILDRLGLEPRDALLLLKHRRERISPSPAQYEAWSEWLVRQGRAPLGFAVFSEIAYRHLRV